MTCAADALDFTSSSSKVLWIRSSSAAPRARAVALRGACSSNAPSPITSPIARTASSTSRPEEIFRISSSPSAMT
jgi:hypothetical protein